MIRLIRITDVRRAGRYAWNDATGQFCVHNPDKGHYGFWIRDEIKGQRVFKHLMSPALKPQLQTWHQEDECRCGFCGETS